MEYEDIDGHKKYIEILRRMTPEQKLEKALELSELGKQLFLAGLKQRHPDLSDEEFKKFSLEQIKKWHNTDY